MLKRNTRKNTPAASGADSEPVSRPEPEVVFETPEHTANSTDPTGTTAPVPKAAYTTLAPMTDAEAVSRATPGHHLLHNPDPGNDDDGDAEANQVTGIDTSVPRSIAFRLYTSHFLSTWNSRLFEFGAALFLTSVFPGTLLPVSIYSLVRNAGYIVFAQLVGKWINRGNRLNVIRTLIVGQRVPVAASCALLLVLELKRGGLGYRRDDGIFAAIVLLAVVEKLCSTMNTISVERDWVCSALCSFLCRWEKSDADRLL